MGPEVMTLSNERGVAKILKNQADCKNTGEYTLYADGRMLKYYHTMYERTGDSELRDKGIALKDSIIKLYLSIKNQLTYL